MPRRTVAPLPWLRPSGWAITRSAVDEAGHSRTTRAVSSLEPSSTTSTSDRYGCRPRYASTSPSVCGSRRASLKAGMTTERRMSLSDDMLERHENGCDRGALPPGGGAGQMAHSLRRREQLGQTAQQHHLRRERDQAAAIVPDLHVSRRIAG